MKPTRYLLALIVLGLSLTACDLLERRNRKYTGEAKLEFFPLRQTVDEPDTLSKEVTVEIQLIGRQRDSDLPVSFTVDDSSTAQAGTHYNLPSKSATIPANSSQTTVTIEVLSNEKNDSDTNYELFLTLQDSDKVEAAENLKTHSLTIRGTED
ncbi:MAG: DUF4843 domain-containing protein [Salinibacter sp.]